MRVYWLAAGLAAAILLSSPLRAAPPPAEVFGDLPRAEFARISPDGKYLAVVRPFNSREKVFIIDLTKKDGGVPYRVGMEDANADEVYWKGDRLVCVFHTSLRSRGERDFNTWSRAVSADPATQTAVLMMYNAPDFRANYNTGYLADLAADDPGHVYIPEVVQWDRLFTLDLFKVDVQTGAATLALHGNWHTVQFLTDGYGHVIGQIEQDGSLTDHVMIGGKEVYSYSVKGMTDFEIEGLTPGPNPQFVVKRPTASGTTGLYIWTPPSAFGPALFENPSYDVEDAIVDEYTRRVIGITFQDDRTRVKYFDPAMQHVQDAMEKAFPGQSVIIESKDTVGANYVIYTDGPKNPPVLSLYTPANHQVNVIDEAYPDLKPEDLGEVRPYPYKARDGLDIHAYLTLPPGRDPHNLPTVVFPHGGPEARDDMAFDWWAQFMATRGYAVLQPNFRGSSGYGSKFVLAGDGEWAGKVQTDVQDGVARLIADGIADPKRICIVGASYGGYMALAGATFSPDLYACAVSFAGVSDLSRLLYTGTTFESEGTTLWKRRLGSDTSSDNLDRQSPDKHAEAVKAPILLIHSDRDATVPIEQSELEEKALKKAGMKVEFVTLSGDDHDLEFAQTRTQLLKEIEKFLATNIGN